MKEHENCWKCGGTKKITHDGITWDCPDWLVEVSRNRPIEPQEVIRDRRIDDRGYYGI